MPDPENALVPSAHPLDPLRHRVAEARARTRSALAELQRGARAEVTRRVSWRAVFHAHPEVCMGLALALGFVVGHRR